MSGVNGKSLGEDFENQMKVLLEYGMKCELQKFVRLRIMPVCIYVAGLDAGAVNVKVVT